jgi:hydroxypyruvate reductase
MSSPATARKKLALSMRVTARHLFEYALAEASIDRAFQRHVDCDKGVLRVCEDLYNLDSYNRVLVIALGKAAHAMVNSLEMQAGNRFQGIVASSTDPVSQIRGFRYFRGGHPMRITSDLSAQRRRVLDCREAC